MYVMKDIDKGVETEIAKVALTKGKEQLDSELQISCFMSTWWRLV